MKSTLKKTALLNIVNYLFMTLLLVACGATSVAEKTSVTQEIDQDIDPSITATPNLSIMTTEPTETVTSIASATSPPSSITSSPLATHPPLLEPALTSTPSLLSGWLLFESAREVTNGAGVINSSDYLHIYRLNLSTKELVQLTRGEVTDVQPSWSLDGSEIVFVSNRSGNSDLYVMNADGSNIRQLTETPEDETTPVWSSDGQQIIYVQVQTLEYGLEERQLYIVDLSGENNRQLINLPGNSFDPDLSPDGRFLAFTQMEPFMFEDGTRMGTVVYLYDMQSAQNFRITSSAFESDKGQFQHPKWLPREGWYLSMIQVPGDSYPVGMKVFELTLDGETPTLQQVLEFDEGTGLYTWGSNGEWLISTNYRTIFNEDGDTIMTTDLSILPITIPRPQTQFYLDPAMQRSKRIPPGLGNWLTNDIYYEGNPDWSPW